MDVLYRKNLWLWALNTLGGLKPFHDKPSVPDVDISIRFTGVETPAYI